jgi:translation elongation factor EF-Ts
VTFLFLEFVMSAVLTPDFTLVDTKPETSERQRFGRVESYSHSDSITQNKGGSLVKVTCDSEAGSRTREFITFVKMVARYAYASSAQSWDSMKLVYPALEQDLLRICAVLNEHVAVDEVVVMKV